MQQLFLNLNVSFSHINLRKRSDILSTKANPWRIHNFQQGSKQVKHASISKAFTFVCLLTPNPPVFTGIIVLVLREYSRRALRKLPHPGHCPVPGEIAELPVAQPGDAPGVPGEGRGAAVEQVVQQAPGAVPAVQVQHVGEAVFALA